jgi:general secretion pathway protein K
MREAAPRPKPADAMWRPAGISRPKRREQGFALLIVLWTMVLLALLVTGITGTGRTEAQLAGNLRENAQLQAEADGAVYDVIFHALATSGPPLVFGQTVRGRTRIRVEDEAGKINPNTAPPQLLQALLRRVGVADDTATSLAAAIADWRDDNANVSSGGAKAPQYVAAGKNYGPPQEPFQSIAELADVLGMTPAILVRLAPHLSIYNTGDPQLSVADPVVVAALRDVAGGQAVGAPASPATGSRTIAITATVSGPNDSRFTRHADVSIGTGDHGPGYRILTWTASEPES